MLLAQRSHRVRFASGACSPRPTLLAALTERHGTDAESHFSPTQKHDPGASHSNDHFWHVVVRGPEVLLNWGKVGSPGKSEVRHMADALLAEAWAADSVTEKLKQGYVPREGEGAASVMRQEGMPREP